MKAIRILLVLVVIGELVWGVVDLNERKSRPLPPLPVFLQVDDLTADELRGAHTQMVTAIADGSADAKSWSRLADMYAAFGFFREAEPCYRKASELAPNDYGIQFTYAICMERLSDYQASTDLFKRAIDNAPSDLRRHECWYFIGRNYLKMEKAKEAAESFAASVDFPPSLYQLADLLVRVEKTQAAIPYMEHLDTMGDSRWVHMMWVKAHQQTGNRDKAIDRVERADRAGNRAYAVTDLSFYDPFRGLYGVNRVYEQAIKQSETDAIGAASVLKEALQIDYLDRVIPTVVRIELKIHHYDRARELTEELIERTGPSPVTLELLGDVYYAAGDLRKAEQTWQRALRMGGGINTVETLNNKLADLYKRTQDDEKKKFHQARAQFATGVIMFRRNMLDDARALISQAVEVDPENGQAWFYLAETQRFLKRPDEARKAYERCLTLDPFHGRAKLGLSRLP